MQNSSTHNLYKCFNRIVTVAQIFGLLPVNGTTKKIIYKWNNLNAIYCHLVMVITFIVSAIALYDLITCNNTEDLRKISIWQDNDIYYLFIGNCRF